MGKHIIYHPYTGVTETIHIPDEEEIVEPVEAVAPTDQERIAALEATLLDILATLKPKE